MYPVRNLKICLSYAEEYALLITAYKAKNVSKWCHRQRGKSKNSNYRRNILQARGYIELLTFVSKFNSLHGNRTLRPKKPSKQAINYVHPFMNEFLKIILFHVWLG